MDFIPEVIPTKNKKAEDLWILFFNNNILVKKENDNIALPTYNDINKLDIKPELYHYLGRFRNISCYSAKLDKGSISPQYSFIDLRSLGSLIEQQLFLVCGKAKQILEWDDTNRYCGRCGTKVEKHPTERAKVCPECGLLFYPKITPAIIVLVTKGDEILLAHNNNFPQGLHSVIAGFVEAGETLEQCVKREVYEETAIMIKNIKYFTSQPWPFPNSLMVAFTAEYESGDIQVDGIEIGYAGWYKYDSLPLIPSGISVARKLINNFMQKYR
jgi:NAD+ diphosphatase